MNFDFIVIGGGIAGLNAAIRLSKKGRVLVVTKERLIDCNTQLAQGGIAASMGPDDSAELHFQDTLMAGAGLCNQEAVRMMVEEGPRRINELIAMGMHFDQEGNQLALTREGAHCRNRVLRAGGDSTGRVIWQSLALRARSIPQITIWEHLPALDLLVADGICQGVFVLDGQIVRPVKARAVLLASGGAGRLYPVTTNPPTATGDGMAMAYRAGAELSDMEFIQFHPTALAVPEAAGFLISEAVRGEGGILRNGQGERFMTGYHQMADLAPRDIVSRAIHQEMRLAASNCVYLDVTHFPAGFFASRFPQIFAQLAQLGINPESALIPIAPAAHYMMGGIKTGLWGETNLRGLFAAGEVANTGVHGANRLASNSLLEGLVFSSRAVTRMAEQVEAQGCAYRSQNLRQSNAQAYDQRAKQIMAECVGIIREKNGLMKAKDFFQAFAGEQIGGVVDTDEMTSCNLGLIAFLASFAALQREESRGGHYRSDFPHPDPVWQRHLILRRGEGGALVCQSSPMLSVKQ